MILLCAASGRMALIRHLYVDRIASAKERANSSTNNGATLRCDHSITYEYMSSPGYMSYAIRIYGSFHNSEKASASIDVEWRGKGKKSIVSFPFFFMGSNWLNKRTHVNSRPMPSKLFATNQIYEGMIWLITSVDFFRRMAPMYLSQAVQGLVTRPFFTSNFWLTYFRIAHYSCVRTKFFFQDLLLSWPSYCIDEPIGGVGKKIVASDQDNWIESYFFKVIVIFFSKYWKFEANLLRVKNTWAILINFVDGDKILIALLKNYKI